MSHGELRVVAQKSLSFVDASERVGDVSCSIRPMLRFYVGDLGVVLREVLFEVGNELVEVGAFAKGGVVNLVNGHGSC